MKGSIIDVFPEGQESFRACVLEVTEGPCGFSRVINLDNGQILECMDYECDKPIIQDIFSLETDQQT